MDLFGFEEIISFFQKYSGVKYIAPSRAGDRSREMKMIKGRGQQARKRFVSFVNRVTDQLSDMQFVKCSNWVNQGQILGDDGYGILH